MTGEHEGLEIEYIPVVEIVPNPRNPRVHDKAMPGIIASIEQHGFVQPIVCNRRTGRLVIGHGRLKAVIHLGRPTIAVVWIDCSEEEELALMIADNRVGERTEWEESGLSALLEELREEDLFTGYTEQDLEGLQQRLQEAGTPIEESDPPDREGSQEIPPRIERGEVWKLGRHRVMCGDASDRADVQVLIEAPPRLVVSDAPSPPEPPPESEPGVPSLVVTDPPYGVAYGPSSSGRDSAAVEEIANDDLRGEEFVSFLERTLGNAVRVSKDPALYVCMGTSGIASLEEAFRRIGVHRSCWIVWDKGRLVLMRRDYHSQFEMVAYGWVAGAEHLFTGDRTQTDLWSIPGLQGEERPDHPTPKPVELFARAMRNSSAPAGVVYDPFLGSGTCLIAAEQEGRICYGMELLPKYAEGAMARWERATGLVAERLG